MMGENALRKELTKVRLKMDTLGDEFLLSRNHKERKIISTMIKKQYYLSVFLEASLKSKIS